MDDGADGVWQAFKASVMSWWVRLTASMFFAWGAAKAIMPTEIRVRLGTILSRGRKATEDAWDFREL